MAHRRLLVPALVTAVSASLLAVVPLAGSAAAEVTTSEAAAALDLPAGVTVASLSGAPMTRAVADTTVDPDVAFNDFPSKGTSYLMLSSGAAGRVFEGVPTSQLSTDVGDDGAPDSSSIVLTVAAGTANAGCLFVDFALGTEETLGYAPSTASDRLSIVRSRDSLDYAVSAGKGYFTQAVGGGSETWPAQGTINYEVNRLSYWHKPGDPLDPEPGTAETPWLDPVTGLNNVTTRDTARIPLDLANGAETVTITVADALNGDLDSVGFLDDVRLGSSCGNGTGVEPDPLNRDVPNSCCGIIRGIRGVGNALTYDPVPSTDAIERYDAAANGWRSPSAVPVELRFRWYRTSELYKNSGDMARWTAIPNADRQSYVPTAIDQGKVLIVLVTGVVDGRRTETYPLTSTADTWYVTLKIDKGTFVEGEGPVVSGPTSEVASVGDTVTGQIGNTVPRQDTYEWQWYAKSPGATGVGSPVSGANGQQLVVSESLAGRVLTLRATAKRDQFAERSWDSLPYGPIKPREWESTAAPRIVDDGTPGNGETLTVDVGTWLPEPSSYSYQWKRDGAVISGATTGSYTLRNDDVGRAITVDVSGVRTGYAQTPRTSAAVTPGGLTQVGGTVTIEGTARVGERLTGGPTGRDWTPAYPTLTYAWFADGELVQTGSSRYLTLTPDMARRRITLEVTATKSGYNPLTVASAPTEAVATGQITPGISRLSGSAKVGQTLRYSGTDWKPTPVTLTFQWKIGGKNVSGTAGRKSSLKLPRSAKGKKVTLVITGTKPGFTTARKTLTTSAVRS